MLKGKVALVTGGSRGIGRAIALAMAQAGADVAIVFSSKREQAEQVCLTARAFGVKAECYACDVSDFTATKETVDQILQDFGTVDILVNNAGITADGLVSQLKEEDFDRVIDINLKGAFHMTKHLYKTFIRKRAGRIINISSVSGICGNAGQANYSASKAGLIGMSKSVARELASRGITCNVVAPGFIESDMTAQLPDTLKEAANAQIPMKRMGTPEEVAQVCLFLAGDAASYMTGNVIAVDGGLNM